ALADEIPGDPEHAGIGFVIDTGSRLPIRFRAAYVSDRDIDDLVDRCTPGTPHTVPGEVLPFPTHHDNDQHEHDDQRDDANDQARREAAQPGPRPLRRRCEKLHARHGTDFTFAAP
ncbi:MAG TPA: hypothetical protein VGH43_09260, partial [Jatrophihabitans sp.]